MITLSKSPELILESIDLKHAPLVFDAIKTNREFLSHWLPFVHYTLRVEDTEAYIHSVREQKQDAKETVYTIWFQGTFAGLVSLVNQDPINRKADIGYWLIEALTGKGVMTQSCQLVVNHAFEKLQLNRLTIRCATENVKSERVAQRLGFHYEGIEREGERHGKSFCDLKVYSKLAKDYFG